MDKNLKKLEKNGLKETVKSTKGAKERRKRGAPINSFCPSFFFNSKMIDSPVTAVCHHAGKLVPSRVAKGQALKGQKGEANGRMGLWALGRESESN